MVEGYPYSPTEAVGHNIIFKMKIILSEESRPLNHKSSLPFES